MTSLEPFPQPFASALPPIIMGSRKAVNAYGGGSREKTVGAISGEALTDFRRASLRFPD